MEAKDGQNLKPESGEISKPKLFTQEQIDAAHEEAQKVLEETKEAYDKPEDENDHDRSYVYEKFAYNEAFEDVGILEHGDEDVDPEEIIEKYLEKAKERKSRQEEERSEEPDTKA